MFLSMLSQACCSAPLLDLTKFYLSLRNSLLRAFFVFLSSPEGIVTDRTFQKRKHGFPKYLFTRDMVLGPILGVRYGNH